MCVCMYVPMYLFILIKGEERSEEHTSELQSRPHLVCRLLLEQKTRKYVCKKCYIQHRKNRSACFRTPLVMHRLTLLCFHKYSHWYSTEQTPPSANNSLRLTDK